MSEVAQSGPMLEWVSLWDRRHADTRMSIVAWREIFTFAREQDAIRADLMAALERLRALLRDDPDIRLEAQNFGDITADTVFRQVDDALAKAKGEA